MAESPLIDLIVNEVLNMDRNSFVHIQQIPQDNCKRIVVIGSDFFQIKWTTYHNESYVDPYTEKVKYKTVEDIIEEVSYSFSASGYQPLSSFNSSNGTTIGVSKVVKIFAEVVKSKMEQTFPNYRFQYVERNTDSNESLDDKLIGAMTSSISDDVCYRFAYYVPEQTYKSAF